MGSDGRELGDVDGLIVADSLHGFQGHATPGHGPLVVLLEHQRTDQANDSGLVRERGGTLAPVARRKSGEPDDVGASLGSDDFRGATGATVHPRPC